MDRNKIANRKRYERRKREKEKLKSLLSEYEVEYQTTTNTDDDSASYAAHSDPIETSTMMTGDDEYIGGESKSVETQTDKDFGDMAARVKYLENELTRVVKESKSSLLVLEKELDRVVETGCVGMQTLQEDLRLSKLREEVTKERHLNLLKQHPNVFKWELASLDPNHILSIHDLQPVPLTQPTSTADEAVNNDLELLVGPLAISHVCSTSAPKRRDSKSKLSIFSYGFNSKRGSVAKENGDGQKKKK